MEGEKGERRLCMNNTARNCSTSAAAVSKKLRNVSQAPYCTRLISTRGQRDIESAGGEPLKRRVLYRTLEIGPNRPPPLHRPTRSHRAAKEAKEARSQKLGSRGLTNGWMGGEPAPAYLEEEGEDDPLIVLVLLDEGVRPVAVDLRLGDAAVGDAGVGYRPAEAHVERVDHTVGRVEPAKGLEDDLVDGAAGLAVYRRAAYALAGEGKAAGQQEGDRRPVVQPEYQCVLRDPLHFEKRADGPEDVDHLQHYWHLLRPAKLTPGTRNHAFLPSLELP
jgi:hypothetical protein